jgi:diguanylate cyclase (GGDEF)-like protein/PAS domain S-box-containing protein
MSNSTCHELKQRVKELENNVREARRFQKALRESEEKFRVLADSTPTAILLYQGDRYIYANRAIESIAGYSIGELLGREVWEVFHPDFQTLVRERSRKRLRGEETQNRYEFKIITKEGAEKWVDLAATTTIIGGIPTGIITVTDINDRKRAEEALQESEKKYRQLFMNAPASIFEIDYINRRFININEIMANVTGYSMAELGQMDFWELFTEESRKIYLSRIKSLKEGGYVSASQEYELRRKDGSSLWVNMNIDLEIEDGQPVRAKIVAHDLTQRKRAEAALHESKELYRTALESSNDGVAIIQGGRYVYINEKFVDRIGQSKDELMGSSPISLVHPDDRIIFENYFKIPPQERPASTHFEVRLILPQDTIHYADICMVKVTYQGKNSTLVYTRDITERRRAEEKIAHLANHDPLTDLPTLRLAKDRLGIVLSLARRNNTLVAVMFIDLDGFKLVNDTLGHDAGDAVLKQVASRLLSCIRESDTVARVGGDEFLIVASGLNSPENASQIAEKVLRLVPQPIIIKKKQAAVGASIGIALHYPDDRENMDWLIKQADEAMYRIKKAGKNGYCFANTRCQDESF